MNLVKWVALALIHVVEPHGVHLLSVRVNGQRCRAGRLQAVGPSSAIASLWDTHSGTSIPVRSISSRATRRKCA